MNSVFPSTERVLKEEESVFVDDVWVLPDLWAISIRGTIDHLRENNPFLELELYCVSNGITCSMVELVKRSCENGSGAVPNTPLSRLIWR